MKTNPTHSISRRNRFLRHYWIAWVLFAAVAIPARAVNTFANTGSLANARQSHTATLLHNGKVLIAGGHVGFTPVTGAELYDPATGVWTNGGTLGTGRYAHTATMLPNGKVLVTGGYNSSGNPVVSAELYDPATGSWSATGSLVTNRGFHTATLLSNGKVLVAGGNNNSGPLAGAELYDSASGTWSGTGSLATARQFHTATMLTDGRVLAAGGGDGFGGLFTSAEIFNPSSGTWSATGALTGARAFHTATLLPNGKVIAAGGQTTGFNALNTAQIYDPTTGIWSAAAALATARFGHTATLLPNGSLLVAGGQTSGGGFLASAQLYDSTSGSWSSSSINLTTARAFHTATLLPNGRTLVAGGVTSGGAAVATAEQFEPGFGSWRSTGYLTTPRLNHTATLLANGKLLVAAGYYADPGVHLLSSAEVYDPASGIWSATGTLSNARHTHTATLLPNGNVLVAGGAIEGATVPSAEIYDPANGNWSATGAVAVGRYGHTATLLPNGKVLVVGGRIDNDGNTTALAELYDPATGAWSPTGSLTTGRQDHTATLLPNGRVLVAGGLSGSTIPTGLLASCEVYDSATGAWSPTGPLAAARYLHTATLLVTGKVFVAAGAGNGTSGRELYDPATGLWSPTGPTTSRRRHTATLLPDGKVLIVGGIPNGDPNAELYDPATGITSATAYPATGRESHTATLLSNGRVLITGGFWYFDFDNFIEYDHDSSELYDVGLGFSAPWQPQITSASFDVAGRLVLKGAGFRGISSTSGGNGSQDSPTNYPIVQLRRIENEQTIFLTPDPGIAVSAVSFTSAPVVPGFTPSHVQVRMIANGIPSAASTVLIGFPSITVELPNGTVIPDGGTHSFSSVLGTPATLAFTIRNRGNVNLTGLSVTKDGVNAADFTLTSSPASPVVPGGNTSFTIQFSSASTGTKTVALHIANNVAGFQPYDINLTANPLSLSFTQDADGDGMSDAAEVQLAAQGFDWQVSQPGLVATYYANANDAGLFTTNQVQALNVGVPLIQRDPSTGTFTLTIGVRKSIDLLNFTPFPMNAPGTDAFINAQGKLEFEFTVPDNAAFFRLEAQ